MALSPDLHVEKLYAEGYVPSSLDAPHSSLNRSATWLGMGMWLLLMPGIGAFVFGLATWMSGTQELGMTYLIIGAVWSVIAIALGVGLIHAGRKNYRDYKKRSGRIM